MVFLLLSISRGAIHTFTKKNFSYHPPKLTNLETEWSELGLVQQRIVVFILGLL